MQFYFVGLAMRSRLHDYTPVHTSLFAMRAHRVSLRIWLCAVEQANADRLFTRLADALSDSDEMLVVEVPQAMRAPRLVSIAA